MFQHADIPAVQPNSPLKAPSVPIPSFRGRNRGCSKPSLTGLDCTRIMAAMPTTSSSREGKCDFGASRSLPSRIPSSTRGHASGPIRRPAARRRSASPNHPNKPTTGLPWTPITAPYGVQEPPGTSLKAAAKSTAQTSSGPLQESTPWHLGAGPTRSLREG